ncbi:MAG TPA: hypothetical protein DDY91_11600 [Planctomycetaceae bacterium]|nr:hypothetical protein [Planctomycetaceae bacterium]
MQSLHGGSGEGDYFPGVNGESCIGESPQSPRKSAPPTRTTDSPPGENSDQSYDSVISRRGRFRPQPIPREQASPHRLRIRRKPLADRND